MQEVLDRLADWHLRDQLDYMGTRSVSTNVPLMIRPSLHREQYQDFKGWMNMVLEANKMTKVGLAGYSASSRFRQLGARICPVARHLDRARSLPDGPLV